MPVMYGQSATEKDYVPRDYSIVPTTPGVAQFLDFQNFQVDNFRGIPQISFPIYVLKAGSISVPITLSYHGGGIRTMQACGNAGMGWTLSLGAEIGHTVNGAPDHAYGGKDKIHGLYRLNSAENTFREKLINKQYSGNPNDYTNYQTWQGEYGQRYYEGLTDLANDTYNLYGLGLSAVFAYPDSKNIVNSSESPILINFSERMPTINDGGCDAYGFEVYNQSGTKYLFVTQDRCRYDYSYGRPDLDRMTDSVYYASAWHLDEITDLNGNKVTYHYHEAPKYIKDMGNSTYRFYSDEQESRSNNWINSSVNSVIYRPQILDSICSESITVKINYYHQVTSNTSVPLIRSISIIADGEVQREVEFDYKHFPHHNARYLKSVIDQGEPILSFEYDDPENNNFDFYYESQDFGGYNNGAENGGLIPTIGPYGMGADRSVVPEMATKGVLTKITYPTGGSTEFQWESNDFNYVGPYPSSGTGMSATTYSKIEKNYLRMCLDDNYKKLKITNWLITDRQDVVIDLSKYYNMETAYLYGSDYYHTHHYDNGMYPFKNPPNFPHVRFVLVNKNGNRDVKKVFYLDKETIEDIGKNQPIAFQLDPGTYDVELINPLSVQHAEDLLEANMRYEDSESGFIYLSKRTQDVISSQTRDYWCGLRIRRIISSTGDPDDSPIRKDYYYNRGKVPNSTSGTINTLPRFVYTYYQWFSMGLGYSDCQVTAVGSEAFPKTPVGNISQIQYPDVTCDLSAQDRGEANSYLHSMTETFRYSSARSVEYNDFNDTPYLIFQPVGARTYTSKEHYRGNLMRRTVGDAGFGIYTATSYDYNIHEKEGTPLLTTDAFVLCDYSRVPGINPDGVPDYCIGTYQIIPYTKTIKYEYTEESDGIITGKDYKYYYNHYTDSLDFNLPQSMSSTTSEGDLLTTYYAYPRRNLFCLAQPKAEIVVNGNTIISARRTEFDSNTLLPLRTYELTDPSDLTLSLPLAKMVSDGQLSAINSPLYEYKYNSQGNLIEINYKGIPLASYIWGYNGLYPIIEALNTSSADLHAAALKSGLTNGQITGRSVVSQSKIKEVAASLRTNLPGTEITSIAYHWIWGVVEMSDGRGVSSTFKYDGQGRLSEIRDFNNYLISKFDYHYKSYNDM